MSKKRVTAAAAGEVQILLIHNGVATIVKPQWIESAGGRLAIVQVGGSTPAATAVPPAVAAPVVDGTDDDIRSLTASVRVTGGQFLEEHYERVRKQLARKAEQDGVTLGEVAFTTSGGTLIGRAAVQP